MNLRTFLEHLEEEKELKVIEEEVHWDLEAGALCAL